MLRRLFPFALTTASLTIIFIVAVLTMVTQRSLFPSVVVLFSFILLALFLTGLIETAIQLFGPNGSVNSVCQTYVANMPQSGPTLNTLAWLEQNSICESSQARYPSLQNGQLTSSKQVTNGTPYSHSGLWATSSSSGS